ncbi:hypothetical protein C7974DRAFT_382059 [Boeremia exigua]|uniref:uncharacterized protein n=1 Tax=Boeremia exigua TaxID=749465 RepID=UPI001E8E891E|nr:uncharacterized protein C7974DRAFT_382059 [Boeremia exigua]KAH6643706.1 hypothetical protein C7974DRAFT_382059 [Boeremia exigua]
MMMTAQQRVRGGVHACQRCRRRKQKCDQRYPQCSNCESAHAQCLSYHSGKQANIPRDYVASLERQIAELSSQNQQLRSQRQPQSSVPTETSPSSVYSTGISHPGRQTEPDKDPPVIRDLVASVRNAVPRTGSQSDVLGQTSGISFAKMVLAAIHVGKGSSVLLPEQQAFQGVDSSTTSPASLPPRHVADHLIEVYFQYRTPHLPILTQSQVITAIDGAYQSLANDTAFDSEAESNIFVAYMVFAIALVDIPHFGGRSSQSDGCFRSALAWVQSVLTYSKSDLDTLRMVLLLVQFVAMSPSQGSLWHLTGFALRLCIDLGLHWETESQCVNTDPGLLDDRRRLWHVTYHFDRLMSITLSRPFGIHDEDVRVPLPNPWLRSCPSISPQREDFTAHTQRAHNHIFTLAKLESEARHVQNSQAWTFRLSSPRPSWDMWLQDMQPRMQEWYATIPDPGKAHTQSIFASQSYWNVIYYNAILALYRPHSNTPYQSSDALMISFEAASKIIAGLKALQREGRVEMLWKSVHHLFMAGLVIIYGLWISKEVRDRTPVTQSILTLQTCASTLSAMSETFKGAAGCRDAFETLSTATTDFLVTIDDKEVSSNHMEFGSQIKDLMNQLRASRVEARPHAAPPDIETTANIGLLDSFDLSELLNTAAQWPDLGELDFFAGYQGDQVDIAASSSATFVT